MKKFLSLMYAGALLFAAAAVVSCSDDAKTYGSNDMSYGGPGAESSKSFVAAAGGGEVILSVEAPGAWTIESVIEQDPVWVQPNASSGTGDTEVVFNVDSYDNEYADRFTQFRINREGSTPYIVTISQSKLEVPLNAADEEMLKTIYEATDGASWGGWNLKDLGALTEDDGVSFVAKNGQKYVKTIDLYGWGLTGTLPSEISFPEATSLSFGGNRGLGGSLPTTIDCPNLLVFNCAWSSFTGTVPQAIADLSKLSELYLDENQHDDYATYPGLEGRLPQYWASTTLGTVYIKQNPKLNYIYPFDFAQCAIMSATNCSFVGWEQRDIDGVKKTFTDRRDELGYGVYNNGNRDEAATKFPAGGNNAWQYTNGVIGGQRWTGWNNFYWDDPAADALNQ